MHVVIEMKGTTTIIGFQLSAVCWKTNYELFSGIQSADGIGFARLPDSILQCVVKNAQLCFIYLRSKCMLELMKAVIEGND